MKVARAVKKKKSELCVGFDGVSAGSIFVLKCSKVDMLIWALRREQFELTTFAEHVSSAEDSIR